MKHTMHLSGIGEIPISVVEVSSVSFRLSGRQALALLRILERNRARIEQQAEDERDQEFGRGPGAYPAEIPQKIKKGDARIGKRAISQNTTYQRSIDGKVTAILRYSNGAEQIEVTQRIYAQGERRPGTAIVCVHADDVDIL